MKKFLASVSTAFLLAAIALSLIAPARAQVSGTTIVSGSTPVVGTCTSGYNLYNNSGVVGCRASSGSGTVTSVSASDGLLSVATPTTTPAFSVAGTSGGIPYFNTSGSWASSAALTAGELVVGGGAGSPPVVFAFGGANQCLTTNAGVTALAWAACGTGTSYTAAANGGLTLTGSAFSLGDGVGISYTNPGALSLIGGTITASTAALNITQTWNASGTLFDAPIFENITNTASATGSLLVDLEVGGSTKFSIDKIGTLNLAGNTNVTSGQYVGNASGANGTGNIVFNSTNTPYVGQFDITGFLGLGGSTTNANSFLTSPASATTHFGKADANPTVAQTIGVQGASGTNIASASVTIVGSLPTGSGAPGDTIFKTGFQGVAATATITFSDSAAGANTCTVNWTANGLSANQAFSFSGGTAPTGSTNGTTYYVLTPGTNSFTCSATPGGTILAITSNGSGTITGQTATAQEPGITALTLMGGTQVVQLNSSSYVSCAALNTNGSGTIGCGASAPPLTIGTGGSLTNPYGYYICTTTCSITLPTPAAGSQFCIRNDAAVTTVITISAISGVQYENTAFSGYGTVTTGTMTSGGALGDKICLLGRDSTHYLVGTFIGTWTNS